jgi:hypothetical protein
MRLLIIALLSIVSATTSGCLSGGGMCKGDKPGQYFVVLNGWNHWEVSEYRMNEETGKLEHVKTVR